LTIISIEEVEVGMQLSSQVKAPNGRKLLPEGACLQEKHLEILKSWGVMEVEIADSAADKETNQPARFSEAELKYAQKLLKPYFAKVNINHPAIRHIFKMAIFNTAGEQRFNKKITDKRPDLNQVRSLQEHDIFDKYSKEGFLAKFKEQFQFISLPDIYEQICEVLNSPKCSARHVAEVVSKDSSLSAKLLKLVNSPFYGFTKKVDTISRAITLLGINKLTTLAQGIAIMRAFEDMPSSILDMRSFWEHSLACGLYARFLAEQHVDLSGERFFTAGLLHDLGKLLILKVEPLILSDIMKKSLQTKRSLRDLEYKYLGFDHAELTGMLCDEWHFSNELTSMLRWHHQPGRSHLTLESSIIFLSDLMVNAMGYGNSGNLFIPDMNDRAWKEVGLSKNALTIIDKQIKVQFEQIKHTFLN
jgi:HD-like signal output (HDOD) protein